MTPQEQIDTIHGGSYTYMSDAAIHATIAANGYEHFPIELSPPDLARLLWALRVAHDAGANEDDVIGAESGLFPDHDGSISEWAGDLASSIAQTLGVEWV